MTRSLCALNVGMLILALAGCRGIPRTGDDAPGERGFLLHHPTSKALLKWDIGPSDEDKKDKDDEKAGDTEEPKPAEKTAALDRRSALILLTADGKATEAPEKKEANGTGNGDKKAGSSPKSDEDDEIVTDRPDFTEASSTVGRGRVQLEAGYTFSSKADGVGGYAWTHTYPEMLFRIGMFADWFEFRIGQFWSSNIDTAGETSITGAEDLYLGVKLGLTEQKRFLPESAIILQMTVPSGSPGLTAGVVRPGFNYCFGWDVVKDLLSIGGSAGVNKVVNELGQEHGHVNSSLTTGISLTKRLGGYAEWFALFPVGSIVPGSGAEHYFDGGFTYKVTKNFQLDIRAGKGLSANSDDYFAGAGFAIRR